MEVSSSVLLPKLKPPGMHENKGYVCHCTGLRQLLDHPRANVKVAETPLL